MSEDSQLYRFSLSLIRGEKMHFSRELRNNGENIPSYFVVIFLYFSDLAKIIVEIINEFLNLSNLAGIIFLSFQMAPVNDCLH